MTLVWTPERDPDREGSQVWTTTITEGTAVYRCVVSETSVGAWQYMQFCGDSVLPEVMSQDFDTAEECKAAYQKDLAAAAEEATGHPTT